METLVPHSVPLRLDAQKRELITPIVAKKLGHSFGAGEARSRFCSTST